MLATTVIAFLLACIAQAATPLVGLDFRPIGRGDLAWVDEGRTSGVAVGENDGLVHPNLSAYGGAWISDRTAIIGTLGIARLTNTTWAGDTFISRSWGVIRPGLSARWALRPRTESGPIPWLLVGAYGDIPSARDVSNAYSEAEQDAADASAAHDRGRLGGFGGRAGFGATAQIATGVHLGLSGSLTAHRGVLRDEDTRAVSAWLGGEASILFELTWPAKVP